MDEAVLLGIDGGGSTTRALAVSAGGGFLGYGESGRCTIETESLDESADQLRAAVGMALASFVSAGTGHISQLCVLPGARGTGLGKELLRRSASALYGHGAEAVSLTVTETNAAAIALYERTGFRTIRNFCAFTWEG